ncbi:MAG: hypothetical protein HRT68_02475 [Flavobacteriaceae bacterium]|nr:hypothetical protein [Flavobacteriaceae bacterium]
MITKETDNSLEIRFFDEENNLIQWNKTTVISLSIHQIYYYLGQDLLMGKIIKQTTKQDGHDGCKIEIVYSFGYDSKGNMVQEEVKNEKGEVLRIT